MRIYELGLERLVTLMNKKGRFAFTSSKREAFTHSDYIFIAVGTPSLPNGTADLTYIQNACYDIGTYVNRDVIIITKSTVPVGTNELIKKWMYKNVCSQHQIEVVSNPEFLREGSGVYDFFYNKSP